MKNDIEIKEKHDENKIRISYNELKLKKQNGICVKKYYKKNKQIKGNKEIQSNYKKVIAGRKKRIQLKQIKQNQQTQIQDYLERSKEQDNQQINIIQKSWQYIPKRIIGNPQQIPLKQPTKMSQIHINSPASMAFTPMARRFNKIQKKKQILNKFYQSSSQQQCSSNYAPIYNGSMKIKLALLNQMNNQPSLNQILARFDNAYDYIEDDNNSLMASIEEHQQNYSQDTFSTASCMEYEYDQEEQQQQQQHSIYNIKNNKNNIGVIRNQQDQIFINNNSNPCQQECQSNSQRVIITNSNSDAKPTRKLHSLPQFSHPNYFMEEEEEEDNFAQLENKINDWLDAQGILQVEPNSRKMSSFKRISINDLYTSSSLIQRRKLRNLGFY